MDVCAALTQGHVAQYTAAKCGLCDEDGKSCAWRPHLSKFIETEGLMNGITKNSGILTYMQVLEKDGHKDNFRYSICRRAQTRNKYLYCSYIILHGTG